MHRVPIVNSEYTEEELLKMKKADAIAGLTERQAKFCEYYIEGHNKKTALIKAGFGDAQTNTTYATRMLRSPKIQRYVMWLKARTLREHMINAYDILDEWIRIAFSDITDFIDIYPNSIRLKPADKVDGQLVKSIKSGRDGISIEMYDKMRALENLAKYTSDMPQEWKEKIELRRQELQEEEFELKKKLYELSNPEEEDDGFIEAIKNSVPAVWEVE